LFIGIESIVPFVYTRCSKCNDAGVMGYCYLDPNRHSPADSSSIKSAFDVSVRVQPDGSVEIAQKQSAALHSQISIPDTG
jgi:hypothetical protein